MFSIPYILPLASQVKALIEILERLLHISGTTSF